MVINWIFWKTGWRGAYSAQWFLGSDLGMNNSGKKEKAAELSRGRVENSGPRTASADPLEEIRAFRALPSWAKIVKLSYPSSIRDWKWATWKRDGLGRMVPQPEAVSERLTLKADCWQQTILHRRGELAGEYHRVYHNDLLWSPSYQRWLHSSRTFPIIKSNLRIVVIF